MALVLADRVRETTTTTGTGTVTLAGPVSGFQGFNAAIGNANTTYYTIADAATGAWEVGLGTYTSAGSTLARTTILSSSNAGAAVNFAAGTKDVFVTQPASRALYLAGAGTDVNAGAAAFTLNGVPYASSTSALATGSALVFDGTNLGIGTSSPSTYGKLAVVGASGTQVFVAADSASNTVFRGYSIGITGTATAYGSLQMQVDSGELKLTAGYSGWGGFQTFYTNGSERARIDSAGNLGIGTSSPTQKLDVAGTVRIVETGSPSGAAGLQVSVNGVNARTIRMTDTASSGKTFDFINRAQGVAGNFGFYDDTAGAYRYIIDSAGNLGLGVTPSAWSGLKAFEFVGVGSSLASAANNNLFLSSNAWYNGTNWRYGITAEASQYQSFSGAHKWYTAPSGTAGNAISFTQAMTLDASGNLLVGTTSAGGVGLTAYSSGIIRQNVSGTTLSQYQYSSSSVGTITTDGVNIAYNAAGVLIFGTNGTTERARITSGGDLLVGTTSVNQKLTVNGGIGALANVSATTGSLGVVIGTAGSATGTSDTAFIVSDNGGYGGYNDLIISPRNNTGSVGNLRIYTNGSERARIDSSGNLGIGTSSPGAKLDVVGQGRVLYNTGATNTGDQTTVTVGAITSGAHVASYGAGLQFQVTNSSGGYAGGRIVSRLAADNNTASLVFQARNYGYADSMTLDASGNLGIGLGAPLTLLHVSGDSATLATLQDTDGSFALIRFMNDSDDSQNISCGSNATAFVINTNATERARIDSSGNLLVGTTSASNIAGRASKINCVQNTNGAWAGGFVHSTATGAQAFGFGILYSASSPNSAQNPLLYCEDSTALRAEIRSNGGLANYSANNVNLSDRREKTNFAPAKSYLSTICAIPVQTFNYVDQNLEEDDGLTLGVVAQDVQAVAPELVMESNWGTAEQPKQRLSIYQTDLQYALMKCIQEQQALITALTARVAALESSTLQ
jgi:hypothetical protein